MSRTLPRAVSFKLSRFDSKSESAKAVVLVALRFKATIMSLRGAVRQLHVVARDRVTESSDAVARQRDRWVDRSRNCRAGGVVARRPRRSPSRSELGWTARLGERDQPPILR